MSGEDLFVGMFIGVVVCLVIALVLWLQALLLMWSWNLIIMGMFHWAPAIGMQQAFAVSVLLGFVFNGLRFLTGGWFKKAD